MNLDFICCRLSVLLGYPLIDYILRLSYKGVGEQTSNGQKTAFTFSMIQYPFVSFLKVLLDNMIRLHHFLSVQNSFCTQNKIIKPG